MKFSVNIFPERKQGSFRRFICLTYPLNDESSWILRTLKALFEKGFPGNAFNSGKKKKTLISDMLSKIYSYSRYSPLLKNTVEVLAFCISIGSSSM